MQQEHEHHPLCVSNDRPDHSRIAYPGKFNTNLLDVCACCSQPIPLHTHQYYVLDDIYCVPCLTEKMSFVPCPGVDILTHRRYTARQCPFFFHKDYRAISCVKRALSEKQEPETKKTKHQ